MSAATSVESLEVFCFTNEERLFRIQELSRKIIERVYAHKSVLKTNKDKIRKYSTEIGKLTSDIMASNQSDLLENVRHSIETTVKSELSKLKTVEPPIAGSRSYARVVSAGPSTSTISPTSPTPPEKEKTRVNKPAIIVFPTTEDKNRTEVAEEWRKRVHFKKVNYAPAGVRNIGKNRLRVEFDTAAQRDETLQRMQPSDSIRAEPSKQLRPMIILKGISKHTPSEELRSLIVNQNADIESLQPELEELHLRFERRNRNDKLYNAVFITSPRIWKKVIELGRLNVDHQRVHVEEFVPLLQCFKCLQFGHLKKHCSGDADSCAHCGESGHLITSCPTKSNCESPHCLNCHNKNLRTKSNIDTNHSPTSDRCPFRTAMRNRVVEKINYSA